MNPDKPLGSVTQGSLSQGLEVRLHPDVLVEDMRVGKFLVVEGVRSRFFCMLTDVTLGASSSRIVSNPPTPNDDFLREVLAGSGTFGTINLTPMLMFTPEEERESGSLGIRGQGKESGNGIGLPPLTPSALASFQPQSSSTMELLPVKTIPSHFSQVYDASVRDFRAVFGWEDDPHKRNFAIGQPLDMDVPICIDLDRFVERSNGVFVNQGRGNLF